MELKPAILYKDEIKHKTQELYYTTDLLYYTGYNSNHAIEVADHDDEGNLFQWAVINNDKLIGYITYRIDLYSACVYGFGLLSFERNDPSIGYALRKVMHRLIKEHKVHRIEWRCVGGNPVKRHYDVFCERYKGRCVELHDVFKDVYGDYHNEYIYEIIL